MAEPPQMNLVTASSSTKEQEARSEQPSSSRQYQTTAQSTSSNAVTEQTPLLGPEPPPTYSDAIAAGARAGDPRDAWRRNIRRGRLDMTTFSRLQRSPDPNEEESSPLLSRSVLDHQRAPESMGDAPTVDLDERDGRPDSHRKDGRHRKRRRVRKALKVFCILIGIVAAITIFTTLLLRTKSSNHDHNKPPGAPSTSPIVTHPGHPQDGIDASSCIDATWMETYAYAFENVSGIRVIDESESWTSAGGQFRVEPAPSDQGPDVVVTVSHRISRPWKIVEPNVRLSGIELRVDRPDIITPGSFSGDPHSTRACYETYIIVKMKERLNLTNLELSTNMLDVNLSSFLRDVDVQNSTCVTTLAGDIYAAGLSGRRTYLHSHSGSITGSYALLDLLHVRSTSGSVVINVDPQKASLTDPAPAELDIGTTSGAVRVQMPTSGRVPARDYISKVHSTSGSIHGSLIFSSLMYTESNSGSLGVALLPYLTKGVTHQIKTVTTGSTDVRVLEPYYETSLFAGNDTIEQTTSEYNTHIGSVHHTTSGSIKLVYPDSWNGRLSASSTSGSIHIGGRGMHQIEGSDSWYNNHQVWERGKGDGSIDIVSTSGSITFHIATAFNTRCAAEGKRLVGPKEMIMWLLGRGKLENIGGLWCFEGGEF
ncbi:hypothetical protein MBLNU457_3506t1 [Dothideomycetes sp. NU457]